MEGEDLEESSAKVRIPSSNAIKWHRVDIKSLNEKLINILIEDKDEEALNPLYPILTGYEKPDVELTVEVVDTIPVPLRFKFTEEAPPPPIAAFPVVVPTLLAVKRTNMV